MADKTVTCTIMRDYWDEDGKRHITGTIVEVALTDEVLDALENGSLQRVKTADPAKAQGGKAKA